MRLLERLLHITFPILAMLVLAPCAVFASGNLDFTLHKLGTDDGPTMLIVGGIQGDEPGGFNAANLIVSQYRITKGSVWVVPNLNSAVHHPVQPGDLW